MNCQEAKKNINVYLDSQLATATEHSLYQHLSLCSHCKQELGRAREINRLLEACCTPVDPPPGLVTVVMQKLENGGNVEKEFLAHCPARGRRLQAWAARLFLPRESRGWLVAGFLALLLGSSTLWLKGGGGSPGPAYLPQPAGPTRIAEVSQPLSPGAVGLPATNTPETAGKTEPEKEVSPPVNKAQPASGSVPSQAPGENKEQPSSTLPEKTEQPPKEQLQPVLPSGGLVPTGKLQAAGMVEAWKENSVRLSPLLADGSWNYQEPAWSPDGQRLLFFSQREAASGLFRPWSMMPDGRNPEPLKAAGSLPLLQGGGTWSPGRDRVAYVQNRQGHLEIWVQSLEGKALNLTPADGNGTSPREGETDFWAYWPVWSPRGELAYLTSRFGGTEDLMLVNPEGGGEQALTRTANARELYPVWSPDGDYLAFYRTEEENGQRQDRIFLIRRDGTGERAITQPLGGDVMVPAWSPDGRQLAINVGVSEPRPEITVRRPGLWLVNKDGSGLRRLASGGGTLVRWSSDGKKIAFTDGSGLLYVLKLPEGAGQAEVQQVTTEGSVSGFTWSVNSSQLVLDWAKAGGKRGLWVADLSEPLN